MNKQQLEMLSVKSAIERTLSGYISSFHGPENKSEAFFSEVDRYVAGLYASRQVNRGYLVQFGSTGDLEIQFEVNTNKSAITFHLPKQLKPARDVKANCLPVDGKDPVVSDFIITVLETLSIIPVGILNDGELNTELIYRLKDQTSNRAYQYTFALRKVKTKTGLLVQGDIELQPYKDSCTIVLPITFTV